MNGKEITEHLKDKLRRIALTAALFVLMFSVITGLYAPAYTLDTAGTTYELTEITPIGDENAEAPAIKAKAAAIYSLDLDKFVYCKNEDEQIDPYSITKILTCYLALENLDLDEVVTVSADAARGYENGTSIFLKEGEKMSVEDLIYGTLLESGNDAAYALGEAVSGSEADFADLMNKTVSEWGCENTHFVNANGWKNKNHYTTARDMAIITKNCFARTDLLKMSNTLKHTVAATNMTEERELKNFFRYTIPKIKGVKGGKTGTWDEDDCSITLQFKKAGLKAIVVLLGETKEKRPVDARKLVNFSVDVTPGFLVSDEGDPVVNAKVRHGEFTKTTLAVSGRTTAYPASNSERDIKVETEIEQLEAPITKGDIVGTYTVYVDDNKIAEHDLVAMDDIATGWLPSYLYISNQQTLIIGGILAGLILIILLLRAFNHRRNAKRRAARREEKLRKLAQEQADKNYVAKHGAKKR